MVGKDHVQVGPSSARRCLRSLEIYSKFSLGQPAFNSPQVLFRVEMTLISYLLEHEAGSTVSLNSSERSTRSGAL